MAEQTPVTVEDLRGVLAAVGAPSDIDELPADLGSPERQMIELGYGRHCVPRAEIDDLVALLDATRPCLATAPLPARLVHGDVQPRNVLVDGAGDACSTGPSPWRRSVSLRHPAREPERAAGEQRDEQAGQRDEPDR